MRARLMVIFTVPGVLLFIALGAAYAVSVARSDQQEVFLDRLSDAGYLVVIARQSLIAGDPSIVDSELARYRDVYGIEAAVLNQKGETWASNGLDARAVDERFSALAGRRSELSERLVPWQLDGLVVAEPVFEGGDLIGAVVTSSDTGALSQQIWLHWGLLLAGGIAALGISLTIANSLASWVLRPVRAVDVAMAEIGSGKLAARIPDSTGPPELRQVIEHFNQMARKVEHLMHKQQEFVSNASHELRNPLHALLLRAEDLALSLPSESTSEVEELRSEGHRMARILDALLMLARDEDAGVSPGSVEVMTTIARRIDGWSPISRERRVELQLSGTDEAWAQVDEIVLESSFDAIADNAIKFSPPDSIVDVTVTEHDGHVEVGVRDFGEGLPSHELESATDRFWRGSVHGKVRGSGLGLAIASEMLETAGGGLRLEPAAGGGLLVTLRVPSSQESS
jgi:signal transduction histidine kinase